MSIFLDYTADTPAFRILEFFIEFPESDHAISDAIACTELSRSTFYSAWPHLLEKQYIIRSRAVGKTTLYKLNLHNEFAKTFLHIYKTAILTEMEKHKAQVKASSEIPT